MHHVFVTFGTVASITLPDGTDTNLCRSVESIFQRADARFSLYREDSELSRINRGELPLLRSSEELRAAYGTAVSWGGHTGGVFTPNRPDGAIDLNGVVKALAIDTAGALLDTLGIPQWSVNVGGDILFRGNDLSGRPWSTGIVDPRDRGALLGAIDLPVGRRAIATSGSAERGEHIWRGTTFAPQEFVQVTVVSDGILTADVLATAIVAGGKETLDELTGRWDIDVLAVRRTGELLATPGIRSALSRRDR